MADGGAGGRGVRRQVVGRWHRLGADGIRVGVVALLMVTYGAAGDARYLALRVAEALFGAVVGVVVNAMVLPPLHPRRAGAAVAGLSGEIADLDREALTAALERARVYRAALARQGPWPGSDHEPPQDWSSHAAAVLTTERALRTLLDAAGADDGCVRSGRVSGRHERA